MNRRSFLNYTARTVAAASLGKLGAWNALAAANPNYKALVCVFLFGGNDGHNTVAPVNTAKQNYLNYQGVRQSLAIPLASLQPIAAKNGDQYGLHPRLSGIKSLYLQGKAAVLANCGSLVAPITRQQYLSNSAPVPNALFSHSNQQLQWQSARPDDVNITGWAGRMADQVISLNAASNFPMNVSTSAGALFGVGNITQPTTVPPNAPLGLTGLMIPAKQTALQQLLSFDNGLQLVQASNSITARGINDQSLLAGALVANSGAVTRTFPSTQIGQQMLMAAKIIASASSLGMNRQIFFVSHGGFDTHSSQLATQDQLLMELDQALTTFYQATQDLLLDTQVTTFTHSEFGRTLQPSSGGGTDHAWGSHHLILGGSVRGGDFYGAYPLLALGGPDDAGNRGVMIPTTSVEQYGATLAKWFGVPVGNLPLIFQTAGNFSGGPDLGFMS